MTALVTAVAIPCTDLNMLPESKLPRFFRPRPLVLILFNSNGYITWVSDNKLSWTIRGAGKYLRDPLPIPMLIPSRFCISHGRELGGASGPEANPR